MMTTMHTGKQIRFIQLAMAGGLLVALAGCGGNGPETVVTGAVTYLDQPVAEGIICFVPTEGVKGPSMRVAITDGQYKADANGGLLPGSYRVEILGYQKTQTDAKAKVGPTISGFPAQQYIPDKYNVKSQLKVSVEQSRHPIVRDFALTQP